MAHRRSVEKGGKSETPEKQYRPMPQLSNAGTRLTMRQGANKVNIED